MQIDLTSLNYKFIKKPLLVGGCAKEYYGIRKSGGDIDLIISPEDYKALSKMYPDNKKDIFGDLGIVKDSFEIWKTINYFDYESLSLGAEEKDECLIISLEKLLFLTALAMEKEKYHKDLELIVQKVLDLQTIKHNQ